MKEERLTARMNPRNQIAEFHLMLNHTFDILYPHRRGILKNI